MSNEFDRSGDEFQHSKAPDFNQLMANTLSTGPKPTEAKPSPNGFDPHKMFVNRKESDDGTKPVDTTNRIQWPEEEVKALEEFCLKYGVVGMNCGNMSPLAAMAMLKNRLGISDGPLEERVPPGYEKLGTKPKFNQKYTYEEAMRQKSLLKG